MKPSCLQSRFVLFAIACVVALQMSPGLVAGGPGAGNKESKTLTVTKECGTATLARGELGYCTVTESNFRPLRGAKIRYFGPGFFTATIHSSIVGSSSRANRAAAAQPLAIAWSEACRTCWEPASSPGGAAR